jgi:hypothetical protein
MKSITADTPRSDRFDDPLACLLHLPQGICRMHHLDETTDHLPDILLVRSGSSIGMPFSL